jgi:hypothetical protein
MDPTVTVSTNLLYSANIYPEFSARAVYAIAEIVDRDFFPN